MDIDEEYGVTAAERTTDEIREIAKAAKLHESELTPVAQVLRFGTSVGDESNGLKLVMLDQELLKQIYEGKELVFKGEPDEKAVLCTESKTYEVKEAETSNSLLLVPHLLFGASTTPDGQPLNGSIESDTSLDGSLDKSNQSEEGDRPDWVIEHKDIEKTFFTYYELRLTKPKLQKLRTLLADTKFSGSENEYRVDKNMLMTFEDIAEKVQASRLEIKEALKTVQALEIDGKYRLLEFEYEFRILSYMLDLIEENSWALDRISREITISSLSELVPEIILVALFDFYANESELVDGIQYYKYDEDKVCMFLARVLLKNAGKFNLDEFMQAWRDSVPEGMQVNDRVLWGEALIANGAIWAFPESELPEDIDERFKLLFQTKPKWTEAEILPYIKCYTSERINAAAILTRHARSERSSDGVRLYSARHAR